MTFSLSSSPNPNPNLVLGGDRRQEETIPAPFGCCGQNRVWETGTSRQADQWPRQEDAGSLRHRDDCHQSLHLQTLVVERHPLPKFHINERAFYWAYGFCWSVPRSSRT